MNSDAKPKEDPLARLPADLVAHLRTDGGLDGAVQSAGFDLDQDGKYLEGYLILTEQRVGGFCRLDGNGRSGRAPQAAGGGWTGQWHPISGLRDARLVEGLGVNLLRLLTDEGLVAEYRCTLRHAKAVAKLHRQLERRIKGVSEEDLPPESGPPDEKKVRCDRCGRVIPPWAESCPSCMSRRKVLSRLLDFVRPHRARMIAGIILAVTVTVLGIAQPFLAKPMIDQGLGGKAGTPPNLRLFLVYVGLLAGLMAATAVLRAVQQRLVFRLGTIVSAAVRDTVYRHLHRLSLSFYAKKQTGSLVTRVTSDSDRLWSFLAFTCIDVVISLLTIAGVTAALFIMKWKLAIIVLLPVPLMLLLMIVFHKMLHNLFHRWWHRWGQLTAVVADALPGVRIIKAFSQEDREIERFGLKNRLVFDSEMSFITTITSFAPLMMICTELSVLLVWIVGGWWIYKDHPVLTETLRLNPAAATEGYMTFGTLVSFMAFLQMFLHPIHMVAHMDQMFNRAATSAQRIFEILDTEPTIFSKAGARPAEGIRGRIELRKVSFTYDGVRKVLRDIDLAIEPGEMIGLAGPSGGGKTTLVNLICRFYDVLEGQILIDGVDVRDYDVHSLRRRIGVVLQEPFLFHGTVAENIAYGNPQASIEQVLAAAKAANAHDFIVGFPDGYDTLVGERGQTLSGGERQRISIARAILNNPRILILDEATSSVDTETEKLIQEALDRLISDRTTIAIAHRLSTLRRANRLVILENGKIVEQGSHEELAAKEDGLYAKLLRMQSQMQSLIAIG